MIEIKNITKSFQMGDTKVDVLKGISLKIERGDFVAIMGPSGSGKSTLMNILGLLDIPSSGSYLLGDKEVATLSEDELAVIRRGEIGFIFQQFNLLPRLEAWQNVALPLIYSEGKFDFNKSQKLLGKVGLADRLHHKTNEVSGGQQQRIAIARSLINEPRIIFADEPTGNLDSKSEKEILAILKDLNNQGITVIIVTHEDEIGHEANRLIRMRDGVIQSDERFKPYQPPKDQLPAKTYGNQFSWKEILEHFHQGYRTLTANKVRSILSMLGILIGVAAVVAMLALGSGAQKSIEDQLSSMGSNLLVLRAGNIRVGGVMQESGTRIRITMDDAFALKNEIPAIADVSPNVSGRGQVTYLNKNWNTSVAGVTPSYARMRTSTPDYGRFFSDDEGQQRALVAVIGRTVARELFGDKNPIGSMIKINRINFSVIGLLPEKGASGPQDQDDRILIPVQTGMYRLFGKNYVDSIDIQVRNKNDIDDVEESVKAAMIKRYRVPLSSSDDAFQIFNMAELQNAISQSSKTISTLLATIAAISLVVGGIGIMNIMLVSVTERTKEIGLRKAVGAMRSDILMQFLTESVLVSFLGGFMGIVLGWAITFTFSVIIGWNASVSWDSILLAFGFSVIIGIVFGIYPAHKASKLHPIEALRYE
ncbi:MacB family efflux pump subunit [Bacteriovorax stolpii]|uniref:MacB family efflux pump subunit n=1 Tax=Bacteriovorax stolpii TaxID=960 RepID=A0A2K9NQL5_BACTC|nr:ABC transporter permease [Bacteriovorax stolpii]AUN97792.1 MacB family efflux pump subunit [Bacteriovorax stolpii]TDP51614.1 macrolide transport system ATP-binding/permease protein [Bacteriovorax stolpii]